MTSPRSFSLEGPAYQVHSEGPACRVRKTPFDHPFRLSGHDERVPPPPPLGGTRLSGPLLHIGLSIALRRARQACLSPICSARVTHKSDAGALSMFGNQI
jgi:hypothetical protein